MCIHVIYIYIDCMEMHVKMCTSCMNIYIYIYNFRCSEKVKGVIGVDVASLLLMMVLISYSRKT